MPTLVRLSSRIADLLSAAVTGEGLTEVRLAGAADPELIPSGGVHGAARLVPLVDFRALSCPLLPDECLAPLDDDPRNPSALAAAARTHALGPYACLRAGEVMFLPAGPWWRTRLRAIQSRVTDPVSFALLRGETVARFSDVQGWSARGMATRAVIEHGAWLRGEPGRWSIHTSSALGGKELAMLFSAARAALFLESIADGEPCLPVTVAETARTLAAGQANRMARAVGSAAVRAWP